METAAALAVFGLPVERYLTTTDHDEAVVLAAIARQCEKLVLRLQQRQAVLIVNAMVKARIGG